MLLQINSTDKESEKKIDREVGKAFTLQERMALQGVRSPKLLITETSIHIYNLLILDPKATSCIIFLRPKGIYLEFYSKLQKYALVIPFYKLVLYKGKAEEYSIYRDNYFIKFRATSEDMKTHAFVKKILDYKNNIQPVSIEDL